MYCQWNGVGFVARRDFCCVDIQRENEYILFQKVALLSDFLHSHLLLSGRSTA